MTTFKPPKPYKLSKVETITTFESWKHNQMYNLQMDPTFKKFLDSTTTWRKKSTAAPNRGLTDDAEGTDRKTAVQKCVVLNLLLDQIASWCPFISRTFIVKQSTSLNDVWQKIREHYGFLSTGSQFLDLSIIKYDIDERPEDLYQRIYMFFEDNLLKTGTLTHNGDAITADEEMSPTVENTITWYWLSLLHPGLPQLVKQRYGAELRNKTLSSLKTEISQAMSSLLDELATIEETKVLRTGDRSSDKSSAYSRYRPNRPSKRSCTLCKAAGRMYNNHWLSQCTYLSQEDKKALSRASNAYNSEDEDLDAQGEENAYSTLHTRNVYLDEKEQAEVRRVGNIQSPVLDVSHKSGTLHITVDSGSTANLIRESVVRQRGIKIYPATQKAGQADGITSLHTVGEVHFQVTRNNKEFNFDGLVVRDLNDEVLGGMPFMSDNDIGIRPAKSMIVIQGTDIVPFDKKGVCTPMIRRSRAFVLKAPKNKSVILPGECFTVETPKEATANNVWAMEPRYDNNSLNWFGPQEIVDKDHEIKIKNTTNEPIVIGKHSHVCQIRSVTDVATTVAEMCEVLPAKTNAARKSSYFSESVSVNPDAIASRKAAEKAIDINRMHDKVFHPDIPLYNGKSGDIQCDINMGAVKPPQRKARLPQYDHDKLVSMQEKFDELERQGVFVKPEEVGVTAEYMNLSFLVQKPSGDHRLVTAFREVGEYSKPQPSIMPNVEDTLRKIGRWKYIVKTDLKQAYYQIPLSKKSMRYAGVATPFKGVRVYARPAMGCPGSETALEELMNRVVGDLIMEECVAKVADDLYCGGSTEEEALWAYERLLVALEANNLGLNPLKTVVFPKRTVILGWVWEQGTLSASPHRIAALAAVDPPTTVRALRSFIGAYKYLCKVIRWHSDYSNTFDQVIAGRQSQEKIEWTEQLLTQFKKVQESLQHCEVIHIAKPSDQIWIRTDGALRPDGSSISGMAATLFLVREGKVLLGGFFNAQLRKGQKIWLPCEVEALAIGSAITYFSPIIVQSKQRTKVATDSKACVEAYRRMCRGLFSNSARVMTYLTAVCRYQVEVSHIAGVKIPFTDYASRHTVECDEGSCQVCQFVQEFADQVVRKLTVKDVVSGEAKMPFVNRQAWMDSQKQCPNLRKVHALLSLGNRPSKKATKMRDVKTYLQKVVIAKDGLLVVCDSLPFQRDHERIVVPQGLIQGLITAFHLRFEHPSAHQLKQVIKRYFYAINLEKQVESVTESCDICNSLKYVPEGLCEQTSSSPPTKVGVSFAFDVIKREKQLIAVLRETVTSYTACTIVNSENHKDLRDSLIILSAELKCIGAVIRVDPAPGLSCLVDDQVLKSNGISVEVGNVKNKNKNPVAERAVQELETEFLRAQPEKGPISKVTLALATAAVNSRIRREGLSSRELWTHRDQLTGSQFLIDDKCVIESQSHARHKNHESSAKSKANGRAERDIPQVKVGSLVYLISERSKTQARDKYIISKITGDSCTLQKFVRGQFRRKQYIVPLRGIYPIVEALPKTAPHNLQCSDASSDSEAEDSGPTEVAQMEGDGEEETVNEDEEESEGEEHENDNVDEDEGLDVDDNARRPRRNRNAPSWHKDYKMD